MDTTTESTTEVWGSGDNETSTLIDEGNFTTINVTLWNVTTVTGISSNVSSTTVTQFVTLSTTDEGLSTTKLDAPTTSAIVQPSSEAYTDSDLRIFAGVLMIIITALALIGNLGVIAGLRHKCFHGRALYTFLNNLAITVLCDCLFNAPFIIGAMLSDGRVWLDSTFLCNVTSFIGNLIHTQIILSLMLLVLDRMLSLKYSDSYIRKTVGVRANLISGYAWVHSMAFTLAIVVTSVESDYFEDRYLCSVEYKNNLAYNVIYSLLCNIAPWVTIMCCYIYIVALASEANARDNVLAEAGYGELTGPIGQATELNHAKPVGVLIFLWCLLIGPFHILGMIYVYSGVTMIPGVVWTIFTCLRFIYDFLVPVVILVAWPESWKECKHFIACRRENAITENGLRNRIPGVRSSWAEGSDGSVTDRSTLDRSTLSRSFNVPVLFPTSNGLQLQVSSRGSKDGGDIEVADFASEEKLRGSRRPPPYLPPLFSVVQSSEEDSFNTDSSMPLKGEDNGLFDLNESADSKTAISQFQLSLGRAEDFHALKSTTPGSDAKVSPRNEREFGEAHKEYSPRHYQKYSQGDGKTNPSFTSPAPQQVGRQKKNSTSKRDLPSNEIKPSEKSSDSNLQGRARRVSKGETISTNTSSPIREQNQITSNGKERSKKGAVTSGNNANNITGRDDDGLGGNSRRVSSEKGVADGDKGGGGGGANGTSSSKGGRRVSSTGNGVGRGLRSREESEKRQRHSSGKSIHSNSSSPRDNGSSSKAQEGSGRSK
ncbi:uncharacterized protein LOC129273390 [Lytechinus pictus]|uniref:uncharacterized protein LOC129273390 n=1 Tax=Lytechinus pictus TaxID=7653 RepID=UPI0030BA2AAA